MSGSGSQQAGVKRTVTRVEIEDDIATIIFDRPEKRNAMNDALVAELDDFFRAPLKV